jgi:biopolymer transport protein ExbD
MRYHYSEADDIIADINVIPMVDICLVLLIIFMVTANYLTTYLNVKLPESKSSEQEPGGKALFTNVTVTRDGPVYMENQLVTLKELEDRLRERKNENPQLGVVLNVDKRANFGAAVAVLDILRELKVKATDITTIEAN